MVSPTLRPRDVFSPRRVADSGMVREVVPRSAWVAVAQSTATMAVAILVREATERLVVAPEAERTFPE